VNSNKKKSLEPLSAVALNSNKSHEMQNFHSSSPSTSEDENSSEVMIAPREAMKSIPRSTTDSLSPPSGSPPQEYIDHSNSSRAVNGKPLSDRVVKKAEKHAGPIQPGNYWSVCFTVNYNIWYHLNLMIC
jgi:hypothetical protein